MSTASPENLLRRMLQTRRHTSSVWKAAQDYVVSRELSPSQRQELKKARFTTRVQTRAYGFKGETPPSFAAAAPARTRGHDRTQTLVAVNTEGKLPYGNQTVRIARHEIAHQLIETRRVQTPKRRNVSPGGEHEAMAAASSATGSGMMANSIRRLDSVLNNPERIPQSQATIRSRSIERMRSHPATKGWSPPNLVRLTKSVNASDRQRGLQGILRGTARAKKLGLDY